jgi:hypothetical protein
MTDFILGDGRERNVLFYVGSEPRPFGMTMAEYELVVAQRRHYGDQ